MKLCSLDTLHIILSMQKFIEASNPKALPTAMPDSSQPHRPRQFISRDEWELYRSKIYKIYVEENNTLSQTMRIMEEMHRFKAR